MGWGRYFLLGDLGQQLDLSDMRRAFDEQDRRDRTQEETIQTLWRENQQLKLAVTAYQRDQGLAATGLLDPATVSRLAALTR